MLHFPLRHSQVLTLKLYTAIEDFYSEETATRWKYWTLVDLSSGWSDGYHVVQRSDLYVTRVCKKTTTGEAEFNELLVGAINFTPETIISKFALLPQ